MRVFKIYFEVRYLNELSFLLETERREIADRHRRNGEKNEKWIFGRDTYENELYVERCLLSIVCQFLKFVLMEVVHPYERWIRVRIYWEWFVSWRWTKEEKKKTFHCWCLFFVVYNFIEYHIYVFLLCLFLSRVYSYMTRERLNKIKLN